MDDIAVHLDLVRQWVWSIPTLLLLAAVGLYLTFVLRGLQFRYLAYGLKKGFTIGSNEGLQGDISPFQSLMTSLAAAIGTGNIAGVATAVAIGGLGALFWMWVIALLGMATKYAESVLAVRYRVMDSRGEMCGGPMYYIEKGMKLRSLAWLFAIFGCLATLGTGNMVQANSVTDAITTLFPVNPWWVGTALAFLTGLVMVGGVKNVGIVASILVPFMALLYLAGGILILALHAEAIPQAFALIVKSAFVGQAAAGGFVGSSVMLAIQMGFSRGVFSNESGLGISSIAAAAAKTDLPGRQALVSMTGTFLSTLVVCSITGLVIAVTGVLGRVDANGALVNGASMVLYAFESTLPGTGGLVTLGLMLFAFTTIVGWGYYGEKCFEYLFGARSIWAFRILYTLIIIPGSVLDLELVWTLADISNGLMVIPNVIALFALGNVVKEETERFQAQLALEPRAS